MNTKEEAKQWIEAGRPCLYRYGFRFKGAVAHPITKEKALELLPHYHFGIGFYELRLENEGLVFNEYSEADML